MAGNPFAADFSTKSDITTAGALMMSALQERAKALDFSKVGEGIQTMLNPFEELENKAQDIRATQTAELINRLSPDVVEDMYKQGFNLAGFLAEQGIDPNNQAINNAWAGQQATRVQRGKQKLQDEIKQAYELSGKAMAPAEFLQRYRAEHPDIPAEYYPFNADFLGSIDESTALNEHIRHQFRAGNRFKAFTGTNEKTKNAFATVAAEELAPKFRQIFSDELAVMNDANQTKDRVLAARESALNKYRQMLKANKIDPDSEEGALRLKTFNVFLGNNVANAESARAVTNEILNEQIDNLEREIYTEDRDLWKYLLSDVEPMKTKEKQIYLGAMEGTPWSSLSNDAKGRLALQIQKDIGYNDGKEVTVQDIKQWLTRNNKLLSKWEKGDKFLALQFQKRSRAREDLIKGADKKEAKQE
jgi:hypothetical protein